MTTGGTTTQKTVDGGTYASSQWVAGYGPRHAAAQNYLTTISFLVRVSSPALRR